MAQWFYRQLWTINVNSLINFYKRSPSLVAMEEESRPQKVVKKNPTVYYASYYVYFEKKKE